MTLDQRNNPKSSVHEAKTCEMIAGTGDTEQMSLITAFSRVQCPGEGTPRKHSPHLLLAPQRNNIVMLYALSVNLDFNYLELQSIKT